MLLMISYAFDDAIYCCMFAICGAHDRLSSGILLIHELGGVPYRTESPYGCEPLLLCYARHDDMICGVFGIYSLSLELTVVDLLFFRYSQWEWIGPGVIVMCRVILMFDGFCTLFYFTMFV